jgi:hypothetical protein
MSLLVVTIGAISFTFTLTWWIILLTVVTYASVVFLDTRNPLFQSRVLEGRKSHLNMRERFPVVRNLSTEQRTRRLQDEETRQKVEGALEAQRRAVVAIEESGGVTEALLSDAVPKLRLVVERLVEVAETREELAGAIRDLETSSGSPERGEKRGAELTELKNKLRSTDESISEAFDMLSSLRARIVSLSTESGDAAQNAVTKLNGDLDTMCLGLSALHSTTFPAKHPSDR